MTTTPTSYLSKTLSASNRKTWTFSTWLKNVSQTGSQTLFGNHYHNDPPNYGYIFLDGNHKIAIRMDIGSANKAVIVTTRTLQDPTSWYHVVIRCDTTQSTAANRMRIYVNGEDAETQFDSNTIPDQNQDLGINMNAEHRIGNFGNLGRGFFGLLAHTHFADGQSYAPSTFGEFDSTTNEWKAKLSPTGITYGTNGFFLKYENASNFGLDSSGQGNNMATSGTFIQDTDTPSNNFCTLHRNLANAASEFGANNIDHSGTAWLGTSSSPRGSATTQMVKDGKWYAEFKPASANTVDKGTGISWAKNGTHAARRWRFEGNVSIPGSETGSYGCEAITYQPMIGTPNIIDNGGGGGTNYGVQASANDIIMMAVDLSNATTGKIWWGKNGTWFNGPGTSSVGNPATGAYPGLSFAKGDDFWGVMVNTVNHSSTNQYIYCNFGRGAFGNTAVSSGNADDNGVGIFEYDVPSGFYAICTKNIKDYG